MFVAKSHRHPIQVAAMFLPTETLEVEGVQRRPPLAKQGASSQTVIVDASEN